MNIVVFVDDPESWYIPYAKELIASLRMQPDNSANLFTCSKDVPDCDICFLLSCSKIVKKEFLNRHRHNIVVHASDLPKGKGFVPVKWQVLEGRNDIVLTLFEAVEAVDAGPYYLKRTLQLSGYELLDEIHEKMARLINEMCLAFSKNPEAFSPKEQKGEETFYQRFSKQDDMLDVDRTIRENFNHFRIEDNMRYPLWFEIDGRTYELLIRRKK